MGPPGASFAAASLYTHAPHLELNHQPLGGFDLFTKDFDRP